MGDTDAAARARDLLILRIACAAGLAMDAAMQWAADYRPPTVFDVTSIPMCGPDGPGDRGVASFFGLGPWAQIVAAVCLVLLPTARCAAPAGFGAFVAAFSAVFMSYEGVTAAFSGRPQPLAGAWPQHGVIAAALAAALLVLASLIPAQRRAAVVARPPGVRSGHA